MKMNNETLYYVLVGIVGKDNAARCFKNLTGEDYHEDNTK